MEFMKYILRIGYLDNCTSQLLIAFGLSLGLSQRDWEERRNRKIVITKVSPMYPDSL
jgi:hypothetical protein